MNALSRLGQNIASADTMGFLIFGVGLFVVTSSALYWAFRYLVKARTLEDVPTSKARSAEQGYVELEGHAEMLDGPPIIAPLSKRECVWWSYTVERYRNDDWVSVEERTSDSLFALRDSTGLCIVDPEGADVYPEHSRLFNSTASLNLTTMGSYKGGRLRCREHYLMPHELICVIGLHRTHQAIDGWNDEEELRSLLAEWKRNQTELINRFDTNNDGVLDQHEWEAARDRAREQIRAEKHRHAAMPGVSVIGAPPDRRPFLIAPLTNNDFAKKLRWKALGSLAVAIIIGSALSYVLLERFGG